MTHREPIGVDFPTPWLVWGHGISEEKSESTSSVSQFLLTPFPFLPFWAQATHSRWTHSWTLTVGTERSGRKYSFLITQGDRVVEWTHWWAQSRKIWDLVCHEMISSPHLNQSFSFFHCKREGTKWSLSSPLISPFSDMCILLRYPQGWFQVYRGGPLRSSSG